MNKKIYNIKNFWSGVFFLLLAVGYIVLLIIDPKDMNSLRNIKSIIFAISCVFIGLGQILRGLNRRCAKEDEQNTDERNKLVVLKTESSAYNISFNFSIVLTILLVIVIGVIKSNDLIDATILNGFIGIFVGVAIMPTIMVIAYIGANIYHNRRN